jgi:hypothetical protein
MLACGCRGRVGGYNGFMEWYRWMFLGIAIVMGVVTAVTVYTLFKQSEEDRQRFLAEQQKKQDSE